jgi:cytochrome c oxidase subunit 2
MFDRQRLRRGAVQGGATLAAVVLLSACAGDNDQNSLDPSGPEARQILDLFSPFFWIAVVIGAGVIGGTIYVALRFREKPGEPRNPKQIHGNTVLEISWTIVPALILMVMAVATIPVIFDLNEEPTGSDVVDITVTGRQWFWEYEYRDEEIFTANEMHIPVGRPVRMTITAPDNGVIHSFWVPQLNGKRDAVPGRDGFLKFEADEPGTYLGQCAEYCGLAHADMRLRVIAQTDDDWNAWVRGQQEQLDTEGQEFAQTVLGDGDPENDVRGWGCTGCHSFDPAEPGATGPNLSHVGDRTTFAAGIYPTNLPNLTDWVHNAPSLKPMGDLQGQMPNFSDQGMTRDEARRIAEFLCNTASDPDNAERCLSGTGRDLDLPVPG